MRIALCDDEKAQLLNLVRLCRKWSENREEPVELLPFASAEAFLFAYEQDKHVDLLLLDIQMPGLSGMDLARLLRSGRDSVSLALITALPDFALDGYQVDALGYLLKPVTDAALFALLDKARQAHQPAALVVDHGEQSARILLRDILYLESQGHYTIFHCENERLLSHQSFGVWNDRLSADFPGRFCSCHRCYLANLAHIASIHKKELTLDTGCTLPMARGRFDSVNQAYMAYYRGML